MRESTPSSSKDVLASNTHISVIYCADLRWQTLVLRFFMQNATYRVYVCFWNVDECIHGFLSWIAESTARSHEAREPTLDRQLSTTATLFRCSALSVRAFLVDLLWRDSASEVRAAAPMSDFFDTVHIIIVASEIPWIQMCLRLALHSSRSFGWYLIIRIRFV